MGLHIIRAFFLLVCVIAGPTFLSANRLAGALVGFGGALLVIALELGIGRLPVRKLVIAVGGLLVGLLTAILVAQFLLLIPLREGTDEGTFRFVIYLLFSYLGIMIGIKGAEELGLLIPFLGHGKGTENVVVVDTSVLIDGRVFELAKGGFLEATIVIPKFVIKELHGLSDCSSDMKRQYLGIYRTLSQKWNELLAVVQKPPEA